MPRSILEILLEKKNPPLVYPSETDVYNILNILLERSLNNLSGLKAIQGFGGIDVFDKIAEKLKSFKEGIESDIKQLEEGKEKWNNPEFQKIIGGESGKGGKVKYLQDLVEELGEARISSLGEGDAFMKANTYFETGESLRAKADNKILEIADIRDKQIKSAAQQSTTDPSRSNRLDPDKIDIVAKKKDVSKAKDDDEKKRWQEENDKNEAQALRDKAGLFSYLAMILGLTEKEMEDVVKKGGDEQKKIAKRLEYLKKAVPYIEKVAGRDFDENNPHKDEAYMNTLMALSRYSPGYKNYEPDIEEDIKITEKQYKKISEKIGGNDGKGGDKKKMLDKLASILERHKGSGIKDVAIREKIEEAKKELEKVDPKTACDYESLKKLQVSKADIETKIEEYGKNLEADDIKDLEDISKIIDAIFDYCYGKEYAK